MNDEFTTLSFLISLATALATGSIGGALLVYYLNRARPMAIITDVALFAPYSTVPEDTLIKDTIHSATATKKRIFVTPTIVQDVISKNQYLARPADAYTHPQHYINYLYQTLQTNEFWREQYKNMPTVINTIMINLNSSSREWLNTFVRYVGPTWNALCVSFVQKKIDLPDPGGSSESEYFYRVFPINTPTQRSWGVAIDETTVKLGIPSEYDGPSEELLTFARKFAKAVASHDIKALKKVFGFLQDVNWRSSIFDETEKILRDQVEKDFSRIIVRGLLINKGKTSYAASGDPKMRLHVKGLSYEKEPGHRESLPGDIELRMRCVKDDYLENVPTLTVNPGTAEPFLAVSEDYLRDMADCEAISQAFASERRCQVEFAITERPKRIISHESPVRTVRIGSGEYHVLPRNPSRLEQLF